MRKFLLSTLSALTIMGISHSSSAENVNKLLEPSTLPHRALPFDRLAPQDYAEAIKEGIRRHDAEIKAIADSKETPTFENTIVALDRAGKDLMLAELALGNIEHASGDTVMMNILQELTPAMTEHSTNIILNENLWKRVKHVYDNRESRTDLSPEDQRLLYLTYKSFEESGANLDPATKEKYRKLNAELSDLNLRFSQNVSNELKSAANRLWVTNAADLEGLPQSAIDAARALAKETLEAEGKADDGSYLFTLYAPSYVPFMKYAKNRDLRQKLYTLYNTRNQDGEFDNRAVLIDIANVRREIAGLFGKKNFAEYQLQNTMAGNPETVYDLLNQLRDAYMEPMRKEINEIQDYARQTEGPDFVLQPWDYSYWADKLKNERYAFNDEDMKPYFELNHTIDGVFGLATKLYGYTFKENKDIPGYHPDVRVYDVFDRDGDVLGVLYADFFYRPGKAPGAWMTEFRGETKDDACKRDEPLISIVTNFSKPVGNEPVLLEPSEVNTFLHEFGHALHGLSAQSKYGSLSGTNVYHDFVELFSQFNENFLSEKKFLDSFAKHYKTGKKMPQSLIDKFVKSQQYGAAYSCIRQLNFGLLDMAFHTLAEPLRASTDLAKFEADALKDVTIFPAAEGCLIAPSFGHIFSGGYAAGYYGYKWAELLDADAFAAFQEHGIFDRKTADKFLKMLQSGGSVDPMTLYVEFRGKKPTVDALLRRDGIKK